MVEVIVISEGASEEQFIKKIVNPQLNVLGVFLKPIQLPTSSQSKGGAVTFDRVKFYLRNILNQHSKAIVSTFLDLYALDTKFPAFDKTKKQIDVHLRVKTLEEALHAEMVEFVGCRSERFIPHIQPYEFEALLFSDVKALTSAVPTWPTFIGSLEKIQQDFATPEHINDSYETRPSKRLESVLQPKYKKMHHAGLAAERITLAVIEEKCAHFKSWMDKLRALAEPK